MFLKKFTLSSSVIFIGYVTTKYYLNYYYDPTTRRAKTTKEIKINMIQYWRNSIYIYIIYIK